MFEELDHQSTPLGDLVLRRRRLPGSSGPEVYEITLDGAFLMSSLVSDSERALATRGLAEVEGDGLRVLVGGLGLGWTARVALDDPRVAEVTVLERLAAVIGWHRRGLVPLGEGIVNDPRCRIVEGDVFAWIRRGKERYHAMLLDVDHSPRALLDPSHASFYTEEGLADAAAGLEEGGVFALWSADAPDPAFTARLEHVFVRARAEAVVFPNPNIGDDDLNTIYLASP